MEVVKKQDWCHVCGVRSEQDISFVCFDIPRNAEHSLDRGGYIRACVRCVREMYAITHDVPDPPTEEWKVNAIHMGSDIVGMLYQNSDSFELLEKASQLYDTIKEATD